ncbi:hypothetical protein [Arthrobacter nitrophenolicus]|uniref:Uncharacterized protein n=2 Tax=Arthrobacter nitrophenolicus TaxID=683150 RepID=A0ACC6TD45_9MICC|nr:hypothetical protein [Arthrobacter nitrophenolicus]ELT44077.1 hypothetical protein G205_14096 [Arthrobacter nitrophenolicus]
MHSQQAVIDRETLVRRHNVEQRTIDPRSPISVGNGEFCFTMDLTGLQSLPARYPVAARDGLPPGTLLGTQSQWGWHSIPPGQDYTLAGSTVLYDSPRGPVPYVDMVGGIVDGRDTGASDSEAWLRANPHRLDLGRIGFVLPARGKPELAADDISNTSQVLDLWTGTATSNFRLQGHPVTVCTACHPGRDELGFKIESAALQHGLAVSLAFPYGSGAWHNAADWSRPDAHTTTLAERQAAGGGRNWVITRDLDGSAYRVQVMGSGMELEQTGPHTVLVQAAAGQQVLDFSVHFTSTGTGDCQPRGTGGIGSARRTGNTGGGDGAPQKSGAGTAVIRASRTVWPEFWKSGAAVELSAPDDPRAAEIERRAVLSQYLTAINCSGSLPPQETGLVCNSWRGRFHLEMHWWHAAHFAAWDRTELLLPALRWYASILEPARQTAKAQGFDGVRWPKQVGPDGRESPSPIGTFLIWQQPHPIHLAELAYRAEPSRDLLEEFAEIVFESAEFMAGFAHPTARGYELGPPLVPAQESYESTRTTASNPTFELAYWQWALRVANTWRERLGLPPRKKWAEVADGMVRPTVVDGVYAAIGVEPYTIRTDHPSMLCALGVLPRTDLIDPAIMRATLASVLADWDWDSTWGWDYPVMAMTAARLEDPETAVDALLLDAAKNLVLPNGHNRQTESLPLYLPGNGGLLAAVALMAAGWDGGPDRDAPGFPPHWTVNWEGLVRAP